MIYVRTSPGDRIPLRPLGVATLKCRQVSTDCLQCFRPCRKGKSIQAVVPEQPFSLPQLWH